MEIVTVPCLSDNYAYLVKAPEGVCLIDAPEAGPIIENDPLFPERVNVNFAVLAGESKIMLRVWERGSGATLACGTGACATAVAAMKRGLISGKVEVEQEGGSLLVEWAGDPESPIYMTGKAVHVYSGKYNA